MGCAGIVISIVATLSLWLAVFATYMLVCADRVRRVKCHGHGAQPMASPRELNSAQTWAVRGDYDARRISLTAWGDVSRFDPTAAGRG